VFGVGFKLPPIGMLVLGLAFGFAVGLHVWLDIPIDAARVSNPPTVLKQDRTVTLAFGLSFALPFGLAYGTAIVFTDTPPGGFALPFGLFLGPAFVLAGAVAGAAAGSLAYGRIGALAYGLAGAVIGGLVIPPTEGIYGLGIGLVCGLAIALITMLPRAWGSFMLGQTWLALCGHQPWRLMSFLEDAHQRGVLRQTGGVYQFRHARLQDHLAKPYRAR